MTAAVSLRFMDDLLLSTQWAWNAAECRDSRPERRGRQQERWRPGRASPQFAPAAASDMFTLETT